MSQKWKNEHLIRALDATGGLVFRAAQHLGCSPQTIYARARRVPCVQAAMDNARGKLVDDAEGALHTAVINQQPWAVTFTLKTIGKDRGYVERQEITGKDGGEVTIRVVYDSTRSDGETPSTVPEAG